MNYRYYQHKIALLLCCCFLASGSFAQKKEGRFDDKFRQLEEILPTPNAYRSASGAPGHEYWQQQADYKIAIELNDENQSIKGDETITYKNNSPDALTYLWLQLDQNQYDLEAEGYKIQTGKIDDKMSPAQMGRLFYDFDGGFKIDAVTENSGQALKYSIVKTMMRVELPRPLRKGETYSFKVKWHHNINDRMKIGGRAGYEYFTEDKNYLYTIAQFFPRMCVYNDVSGWQHKQFLGAGEFTLCFGNYEVAITVPSDHIVGATGLLQNAREVLTADQIAKYESAKNSLVEPVIIVSQADAVKAEASKATTKKTWIYKAENVRDFAFVSSRKFIWDAMGVKQKNGTTVLAMSYYPKEGNPLWEQYSTKAVAHTVKWYSHYTFDYPYPVAISVHTDQIGMEYPMICFNGGRPEKDGTYSDRVKYGMISVIIHEVGHNYFPMIVNSDERQWTWMDEGLNSFLEYLAEQQWERDYPSRRGPAANLTDYMKGDQAKLEPIMTNSESLRQFGNNAYGKPATALNILRETILGREQFDYAFKTYSQRWMFKQPMPADFFRSMEDASGVDLDWFWHGWFYTTDYVDIAVNKVRWVKMDSKNPEIELAKRAEEAKKEARGIGSIRNEKEIAKTYNEQDPKLNDFYNTTNKYEVSAVEKEEYQKYLASLDEDSKKVLDKYAGENLYEVTFELVGELVSPIVLELQYTDGTKEYQNIPAEIWRLGDRKVTKVFKSKKDLQQLVLDPYLETCDVDVSNNYYPNRPQPSRFEIFKGNAGGRFGGGGPNPMQKAKAAKKN